MFKLVLVNNPENFTPNNEIISDISKNINSNIEITQKWILNIIFIDWEEMKNLNKQYRQKDSETDVLSFHYFDNFEELKRTDTAWEIVMLESKILSQAPEYNNSLEEEFYKLLIHSILHIIWFDHEEDSDYENMKKFEDKIALKINKKYKINIK